LLVLRTMSQESSTAKKWNVFLPKTDFPMKGELPKKEPELIQFWQDIKLREELNRRQESATSFTLPDGPPYANGSIHIGHALNKVLKDIIVKYKSLRGYRVVFRPGWDCHGLPIEQAVSKKLGEKARSATPAEIRALCRQEAQHWIGVQKEQFRRLGVLADWEQPYYTMDPAFEAEEVREFARAFEKGVIYQGVKPVYWNWSLQTALAEAEVEYHNIKSPSIYVQFPLSAQAKEHLSLSSDAQAYAMIWTTTPWTLPANVAIAAHPELSYGLYQSNSNNCYYLLATDLAEVVAALREEKWDLVKSLVGQDLEGLQAQHPFIAREVPIVLGQHVTKESGTGLVHTAPGHGPDDFAVGKKYGLPVLSPVGPDGCFTQEVPEWAGLHIYKANPLIVEKLKTLGLLYHVSEYEHSYPHCWRTKIPLIFRATSQWFLGLDLPGSEIRKKSLEALSKIEFFPEWGLARFQAMIENRPDWCLSRQRIWGVPIPVYICKKTGAALAEPEIMYKIADLIEKGGIEAYYTTPPEAVIGPRKFEGEFGAQGFKHSEDILDVWFDSGIVHAAVQGHTPGMSRVADIYLEGSDQHRGWFNTSMLTSMVTQGHPPFKALVTHGFILAARGEKMSKSKGQGADPMDFSSQKGADILRLWCAHEDYGKDILWGQDLIDRVSETYRKWRNSFRFLLGALADFQPDRDALAYEALTGYDQWALHRLARLHQDVTKAYDEYAFYRVYHLINQYVTTDLSAGYVDVIKDRLYTWRRSHPGRRSCQTVLYQILQHLVVYVSPILSFLAEEVYQHIPWHQQKSVFLESYPTFPAEWLNEPLAQEVESLLSIKEKVQKALEEKRQARVIGSSLEASVSLTLPQKQYALVSRWAEFKDLLIVSELKIREGEFNIQVEPHAGKKCSRCWKYYHELLPEGVCQECALAEQEMVQS